MNNEKEFFVNDVETNVSEDEIVLAPPTELIEEAKEIVQNTKSDEKFPFMLQYDANQKDFLLSMLETVGAIVEDDDEEGNLLSTQMNMTQLAFIKQLDAVERVKTDEGINPFLAEEAVKLTQIQEDQQEDESLDTEVEEAIVAIDEETLEVQTELVVNRTADANLEATATAEATAENDGVAVASVAASARSSCGSCSCPTNISMATAATISDESYTSGYICCPGTEQWFKFVATRTGQYTICTTGNLDTIGTLYDCNGNQIVEVDDYAPCGKINFRIVQNLTAGNTYYVKVGISKGDVGSYTLRVTERVFANYVTINKDTIVLEKGVTYELPITPNYTYKGYNGAQPIPGLSVSINPSNANEQKIWWWEQYGDVLDCSYGWDDDGDRYIHVTATEIGTAKLYAEDWAENGKRDECTIYVGGAPVTGITLDRSTKIVSLNDTEQLTAIITPSNALNKGVTWNSSNWGVVDVDSDGVITGLKEGTATISATTDEGGYIATCIVTVDKRPKVTIQKDDEYSYGDETYFNIVFADGKVWQNVGCDLTLEENRSNTPLWNVADKDNMTIPEQRYIVNHQIAYSANQLAFAYLCDPFGVEFYMRQYSTSEHSTSLAESLWFKDEVFKEIFGCWPRLIKIFPDESVSYYEYSRSISDATREDYLSDAELLFGEHPVYDWLTFAELAIAGVNLIVTTLLSIPSETLGAFISSIDLTKYLFFNGAIEDAISSGESAGLDLYVKDIINSSTTNQKVRDGLKARFGVISNVVGAISTVINTGLFFPSTDELSVCNKVNSEQLRASFVVDDEELSLQELIDCATS